MKNKAKPKGKDLKTNEIVSFIEETNSIQDTRARNIDDLVLHDDLMMGVLGTIKKDLAAGLTSEQILEKYSSLAAARVASIAATEADSSKALAAAKDILDRAQGRAVERKQIHHKLDKVDEKQLDAILLTELEGLELEEEKDEI